MSKKALFFDIDGTLLSETNRTVPKSAVQALLKAREKGHLVFINTGRTYCQTRPIQELVEAAGYLCGCGTYIKIGSRIVYEYKIPHEIGEQVKKDIISYGFEGWLEASEGCYFPEEPTIPLIKEVKDEVGVTENVSPLGWKDDSYRFDKFCMIADSNSDKKGLFPLMEKNFEIMDRGRDFYECVPLGHSKASAMEWVLNHYQISLEDAYVFGDSSNDLSMFVYAKNTVLMKEHDKVLEPYASFVTKSVEDNGIAFAMEQLGLI